MCTDFHKKKFKVELCSLGCMQDPLPRDSRMIERQEIKMAWIY